MLLPEESELSDDLIRALYRRRQPSFQIRILLLGGSKPLVREEVRRPVRRLERLTLFDEFRGAGLPTGTRSLAWRLTFRDATRTLRDKEIEGRTNKILRALEGELGVRQRSA
jgi:hypothetical protein